MPALRMGYSMFSMSQRLVRKTRLPMVFPFHPPSQPLETLYRIVVVGSGYNPTHPMG